MARVEIIKSLKEEILKKFKKESKIIFRLMHSLSKEPKKGKSLGIVGEILIKELRYKGFRFYFLADGYKIKFLDKEELTELLLTFVRMSNKKQQQEIINEIKNILRTIGPSGF